MSLVLPRVAGPARRGDVLLTAGIAGLAIAYSAAILLSGDALLLVPLLGAVVVVAIAARPVVGVYLLFGIAILLEQFVILGLQPITVGTHVYQNLSAYTEIPLRLSIVDLLLLLTAISWAAHVVTGRSPRPRAGPFGGAVAGYGMVFVLGTAIGAARGGAWDLDATLAELRGPVQLCATYFLAANLIRSRADLRILVYELVVLVGVKGLQGILNFLDSFAVAYNLEAVTGHEDVIFFDLAIALAAAALILRVRSKLAFAVLAVQPLIIGAEVLTERRVGFVALGVVLLIVPLLAFRTEPRRALAFAAVGALAAVAYITVFWDSAGPLGEPIRAVRSVVDNSSSLSRRDQMSDDWRVKENANIAFTIQQLPLTGVGLGQEYLLERAPPPLPPAFTYWRYITHNALLWLWLKAGPIGALALWFLVARVVAVGSASAAGIRDLELRWFAFLPVCLIAIQIVFSAVELGLSYSRTMIVLGGALGMTCAIVGLAGFSTAPRGGAPVGAGSTREG